MISRQSTSPNETEMEAQSFVLMGTIVNVLVVGDGSSLQKQRSIARAIEVMRNVENACSRFDEQSELRQLCQRPYQTIAVSPILFYALEIALAVSELTCGVFDPTVGRALERQGFNKNYLTGAMISTPSADCPGVSYRHVRLFKNSHSVLLDAPMALDLGAVAKGLAVDLAVKELKGWSGFAIDAGGDCYVEGLDPTGQAWTVGIEDPRQPSQCIRWLQLSGSAVCTSGNYKRISPIHAGLSHLYNPKNIGADPGFLSVSVVAPLTVLADVSATAAFLLGHQKALEFIESQGLAGMAVLPNGQTHETATMKEYVR
jgi:thiamine biosynthesis lipoprotein